MARAAQLPRPLLLRCYGREPCILVYGEVVLSSHACRWHWLDAPDILSQARGCARSDTLKPRESNSRVRGIVGPSYEVTLSQNYAWALIKNSRRRLMTVLIRCGAGNRAQCVLRHSSLGPFRRGGIHAAFRCPRIRRNTLDTLSELLVGDAPVSVLIGMRLISVCAFPCKRVSAAVD